MSVYKARISKTSKSKLEAYNKLIGRRYYTLQHNKSKSGITHHCQTIYVSTKFLKAGSDTASTVGK